MTVTDFLGCALLAFGPPLAMFTFTIAVEPIRIIILIASTFFWLISLYLSSAVWYLTTSFISTGTPVQKYLWTGILYSVVFQEIFRYFLYKVMRKAERSLEKVTNVHVAESRDTFAYVCGLGFGLMSGAFALINVLADAVGPGTMGLQQGNEYFFLISAATTLCFILLHTFWGIIFFSACDKKNYFQVTWVVASHMFVSFMTILNSHGYYSASLFTVYIVLLVNTVVAFNVAGGRVQALVDCIIKK